MLDPNSVGASGFKRTFSKEYSLFERSTRDLANGYVSHGFTENDYLGMWGIASSTAVAVATSAALAIIGITSTILSLGIGLVATLVGIGAAAGFAYHRNKVKKQKCIDAVDFIASNSMLGKVGEISDRIANQFSDYLNHCTDQEAYEFARKVHHVVAAAIMEREVKAPMELVKPEYMVEYQRFIPVAAKPNIFKRLKQNIVEAWCGKKKQEKNNVTVADVGIFKTQRPRRKPLLPISRVDGVRFAEPVRPRL
jgi:hypothetical protein